jgi:hypothetical protein
MRAMRWLLAAALGCAFLVGLSMPQASVAADCTYELGFAVIRDLIPDRVGLCLENAHGTENGDVLQATSLGLLVWRKADNWTAYTNGDRTWVNGPCGLQERAEDHRFLWEISNYTPCTEPGTVAFVEDTTRPTPTVNTAPVPTSTPIPTPTTQPPPQPPTATPQPLERHGSGTQKTTAFRLPVGSYTVAWSIDMVDSGYCSVWLTPTNSAQFGDLMLSAVLPAGHSSGSNRSYNRPAGDYYFDVTGCDTWSLTIRPYSP